MDFSAWSPSHLIVAGLAFTTIIGQTIVVLARLKAITERLEKRIDKQDEMYFNSLIFATREAWGCVPALHALPNQTRFAASVCLSMGS